MSESTSLDRDRAKKTFGEPTLAARPSETSAPMRPSSPAPRRQDTAETDTNAAREQEVLALDRIWRAGLAQLTHGITPFGLSATLAAWWIHLLGAPGKQLILGEKAVRKTARLARYANAAATAKSPPEPCIAPLPHDRRFTHEAWQHFPYNLYYQSFLLTQQWWHNATTDIEGLSKHQEQVVSFAVRQMLDVWSPSNWFATNPEVIAATTREGGFNLVRGVENMAEDVARAAAGQPPVGAEAFVPGQSVAVTKGSVVYRNRLIELIQYAPATGTVKAEPILIVPAWIMKFYILDLSPENSLVRYLVSQGHTVFIISWLNPTAEDHDLGMDDYVRQGVGAALDAVGDIVPGAKTQLVGYCIGGTLATIAAAAMARDGDDRLASLTLFAAQTDFTEAGELTLYIDESQVTFMEDMMWSQGVLDARQMAGAFQFLRSNDLIWSRYVHSYLMGERAPMFDLMAWNADATRMPYRMHSEYLRRLLLENQLAEGNYDVEGQHVAIADIEVPIFCVATESDHVAPWRSVYKLHLMADADITFVLTNGGHNAGIVSEPGRAHRRYRIHHHEADARYLTPERWMEVAEPHQGSWWPAWADWLAARASGETTPPGMGGGLARYAPKADAPGTYVHLK